MRMQPVVCCFQLRDTKRSSQLRGRRLRDTAMSLEMSLESRCTHLPVIICCSDVHAVLLCEKLRSPLHVTRCASGVAGR